MWILNFLCTFSKKATASLEKISFPSNESFFENFKMFYFSPKI
jgi:hypothetical protein